MPRRKLDDVKSLLLELHVLEPVPDHAPYSYAIPEAAMKWLGSPAKSRREMVKRLTSFLYPYPEGNKSGKTFYIHLKSLGLLNSLLTSFLINIRRFWYFQHIHVSEIRLRKEQLSHFNIPLGFHRKMLHSLFAHLNEIACLAQKSGISEHPWLSQYVGAIHKQLLNEGAAYFPQFRRGTFTPAHKVRVWSHKVHNQVELYFDLLKLFSVSRHKSKKLARQVAAVICSGPDCALSKSLDPDPEQIRKYVRDFQAKQKRKRARWTKNPLKPAVNS